MKEQDIRPQDLFNQFLAMLYQDVLEDFQDQSGFQSVSCPACGSESFTNAFVKFTFQFVLCGECDTLYASPRPDRKRLDRFYSRSKAVEFWVNQFYAKTRGARQQLLFRPRAQLAYDLVKDIVPAKPSLADIGCGIGMLLEEAKKLDVFETIHGVEPGEQFAEMGRANGFQIVQKSAEDLTENDLQADVVTCFEVLEHVFDPLLFLSRIRSIIKPDGRILFTTLTGSGFDIQVLWENSKSICPPLHLNFISTPGMRRLLERSGFQPIEITTPGKLDVDIVANIYRENPGIERNRFAEKIVLSDDDRFKNEFQGFLKSHCLSSHIQVIAKRIDS